MQALKNFFTYTTSESVSNKLSEPSDPSCKLSKPSNSSYKLSKPSDPSCKLGEPSNSPCKLSKPSDSSCKLSEPSDSPYKFTLELLKQLSNNGTKPAAASIITAFNMLDMVSKLNDTKIAFIGEKKLGSSSTMKVTNLIYSQDRNSMKKAKEHSIPFYTDCEQANEALDKGTDGMFKDILKPSMNGTIISTALQIEEFENAFDKNATRGGVFSTGETVEFMHSVRSMKYLEHEQYQGVILPYASGNNLVTIGMKESAVPLNNKTADFMEKLINNPYEDKINLSFPKHEIKSDFSSIKGCLVDFCQEVKEDPKVMESIRSYHDIIQSAYMKTNEEGTKAIGVTMATRGSVPILKFDHPHLSIVIDKNKEPTFAAYVTFEKA